jgi:hypothetical protein
MTIEVANKAVLQILQNMAALHLIRLAKNQAEVDDFDEHDELEAPSGLPGEAGCAERLAAAEAYRKSGGKYLTLDEFDNNMKAAIARGKALLEN